MQRDDQRPLLTLAMIVRDEAATIERVITSARGLVDDIVVYDTGSTDDTVSIARRLGARVVEGTWRDDFAWARNQALDLVQSDWALVLDSDEEVIGTQVEFDALREFLQTLDDQQVVLLACRSLADVDGSYHPVIWSRRIMRPHLRYRHRVHEMAMLPDGSTPVEVAYDTPWVRHHGYLGDQNERLQRNLRLARARLDESNDPKERAVALIELGRSLMQADQRTEALAVLAQAIDAATCDDHVYMARLLAAATVGCVEGQEAATAWCEPLFAVGGPVASAARWLLVGESDPATALGLIQQIDEVDYWYIHASRAEVAATRAYLRMAFGDAVGASHDLFTCAGAPPHPFAWWSAALTVASGEHFGAGAMIARLDPVDLPTVCTMLTAGPTEGALALVVALIDEFGPEAPLVEFLRSYQARAGGDAALDAQALFAELGADPSVAADESLAAAR